MLFVFSFLRVWENWPAAPAVDGQSEKKEREREREREGERGNALGTTDKTRQCATLFLFAAAADVRDVIGAALSPD